MLCNRRYLEEALPKELSRAARSADSVGVLVFDVDHFKQFNDRFGHAAGDAVLREIGTLVQTTFRGSDVGARLGGEEFVVVLPSADQSKLVMRAERLRLAIKGLSLSYRAMPLGQITISVGAAAYPHSSRDSESLLRAADLALYRAKAEGRDRVAMFEGTAEMPDVGFRHDA